MIDVEKQKVITIGDVLNNKERPLKERFRALFTLKNIGGEEAIVQISRCFEDDSALLKHELAYCLGQMQDPRAIKVLTNVLMDESEEPMVRHEAGKTKTNYKQVKNFLFTAEAMGAIGVPEVVPILEKYKDDPVVEVAETCSIAIDRVKYMLEHKTISEVTSPYCSVDPSPAAEVKALDYLKDVYLNSKNSLFERYRAMFSLRNIKTEESALILAKGLKDNSALFRHEVAFVLGQLQLPCTINYLKENLENENENEMVRHECAEALGVIATNECTEILSKYLTDDSRVVKESCEIALDICEYENSPEFQYADALVNIA